MIGVSSGSVTCRNRCHDDAPSSAAAADVPEWVIALQTGHQSMAILRRYIREGSLFRENAAARVGL